MSSRSRASSTTAADLVDKMNRHLSLREISTRSGIDKRILLKVQSRRQNWVTSEMLYVLEETAFVLGIGDWPESGEAA